jgi:potassium-transporting ATPase KdpC subunit
MRRDLLTSAIAIVAFTILFGVAYPLVVTGIGQVAFHDKANGSLVKLNGKVVGSRLIGQDFRRQAIGKNGKPAVDKDGNPIMVPVPRYFQERPSITSYSADATAFSNLGPNAKAAREAFKVNLASYLQLEGRYNPGLTAARVPIDAVTNSASGIDPHISPANARIQAKRIAAVRRLPLAAVDKLISDNTDGRFLGVLGEPGVNVLELNLALDGMKR